MKPYTRALAKMRPSSADRSYDTRTRKTPVGYLLFAVIIMGTAPFLLTECAEQKKSFQHTSWRQYGGSSDQSRFVINHQITKENVKDLEVAWFYPTEDERNYLFNPVVVDSIIYLVAKDQSLIALNAATGKELWIHAKLSGITWKGLNYWENEDRSDRRLIFCMNNTIQEIDALTGKSILTFGDSGVVDLKAGLERDPSLIGRIQPTTPGVLFEDLLIMGSSTGEDYFSSPGHLRAYNVITGKMEWIFHTIPQPGEFGYDTWPKDAYQYAGGVNTWGEISLDEEKGVAYFPVGSPTYDYYGGDRAGNNLFGNCLLALDARTGRRLWHYQLVHHDLWDYDNTAAPQLLTIEHNGTKREVVAQATKQGYVFVFDRVTGEPIWDIQETPVPPSDVPGEWTSPTQPIPTVPPPFTRHVVTADDINPYYSDEKKEEWRKRLAEAKTEFFSPPSDKHETIVIPGAVGGANFGNSASNPEKGLLYVIAYDYPSVYKLTKVEPTPPISEKELLLAKNIYQQSCRTCHGKELEGGFAPALKNAGTRVPWEDFKSLVSQGKGQMPAFVHINDEGLEALYKFLGGSIGRRRPSEDKTERPISGPVVATGGAPLKPGVDKNLYSRGRMKDYPAGVARPENQYRTGYGLEYMDLMSPPWTSIVAYDLNTGTIRWRKPLGENYQVKEAEREIAGIPGGSARKGMIVTSTGVVFCTSKGGLFYAFDADTGEVLWKHQLSKESMALPMMYELNGKTYIVVSATAPFTEHSLDWSKEPGARPSGYVVFSLPEKK